MENTTNKKPANKWFRTPTIAMILILAAVAAGAYFFLDSSQPRFLDHHIISSQNADALDLSEVQHQQLVHSILKNAKAKKADVLSPIAIDYPFDQSIFPQELVAPTFLWHDHSETADLWLIDISFEGDPLHIYALTEGHQKKPVIDPEAVTIGNRRYRPDAYRASAKEWRPEKSVWETIKEKSVEKFATVTITGVIGGENPTVLSRASSSLKVSKDPAGAPIFYRDVPLMPNEKSDGTIQPISNDSLPLIKWRLRDLSKDSAPAVLKDMPTCANCHTFSADGKVLGMDMDGPNGDKGAYGIIDIDKDITFTEDDIMSWNSVKHIEKGQKNFGLFSQVSPDGRYVVSTLNESTFIVNYTGYRFLQSFYPTRGVLAIYDRETDQINFLKGADDPDYVQANGCWSPDGKTIIFSRAPAKDQYESDIRPTYAGDPNETDIQYDLYTIPFNDGKGGKPTPLKGASKNGMSNSFPRYSPDGKWIVFVQASKGQLMRPDSKLFIIPAEGGVAREMNCNLSLMNSWHSWSPNSRWLVFSSKGFRPFTQMFLTHIDENGNDSPPILIPYSTADNRAVNIPEFLNNSPDAIASISAPTQESYRYYKTALKLMQNNQLPEAMAEVEISLQINPFLARAHYLKGLILLKNEEPHAAIEHMETALDLDPEISVARERYAALLKSVGRVDEAIEQYKMVLLIDPKSKYAMAELSNVYASQGEIDQAVNYIQKLLELTPNNFQSREHLISLLKEQNNFPKAYEQCLYLVNKNHRTIDFLYMAAWMAATCKDQNIATPEETIQLAKEAARLTNHQTPEILDTLAAAYASAGKFDNAVEIVQVAIKVAGEQQKKALVEQCKIRLELYRNNQPYYDPQFSLDSDH